MRLLLIASGALFLASTGAFFLYVPPLSIATVALILVGLTLMFGLGFQAGGQGMIPCEAAVNQAWYFASVVRALLQVQSAHGLAWNGGSPSESRFVVALGRTATDSSSASGSPLSAGSRDCECAHRAFGCRPV